MHRKHDMFSHHDHTSELPDARVIAPYAVQTQLRRRVPPLKRTPVLDFIFFPRISLQEPRDRKNLEVNWTPREPEVQPSHETLGNRTLSAACNKRDSAEVDQKCQATGLVGSQAGFILVCSCRDLVHASGLPKALQQKELLETGFSWTGYEASSKLPCQIVQSNGKVYSLAGTPVGTPAAIRQGSVLVRSQQPTPHCHVDDLKDRGHDG